MSENSTTSSHIRETITSWICDLRGLPAARVMIILTSIYSILALLVAALFYLAYVSSPSQSVTSTSESAGLVMFVLTITTQFLLVVSMVPIMTARAVYLGTEDSSPAQSNLASSWIVFIKLVGVVALTIWLIAVALPLQVVSILYGGIRTIEVLLSAEWLLTTAIGFGAIGTFMSTLGKPTRSTTTRTYVTLILLCTAYPVAAGVLLPGILWFALGSLLDEPVPDAIFNYTVALVDSLSPFTALIFTETALRGYGYQYIFILQRPLGDSTFVAMPMSWVAYTLCFGLVSLILIVVSVTRLRRQTNEN